MIFLAVSALHLIVGLALARREEKKTVNNAFSAALCLPLLYT
jgi:hypothetical protein